MQTSFTIREALVATILLTPAIVTSLALPWNTKPDGLAARSVITGGVVDTSFHLVRSPAGSNSDHEEQNTGWLVGDSDIKGRSGSTSEETGGAHEETGGSHEETGGSHEETGGSHEETGGSHEETGGAHEETGGAHEETGGSHEETGGSHEETGGSHEETGGSHEETGGSHEETGGSHEETGGSHEETGGSHEETGGSDEGKSGYPTYPKEEAGTVANLPKLPAHTGTPTTAGHGYGMGCGGMTKPTGAGGEHAGEHEHGGEPQPTGAGGEGEHSGGHKKVRGARRFLADGAEGEEAFPNYPNEAVEGFGSFAEGAGCGPMPTGMPKHGGDPTKEGEGEGESGSHEGGQGEGEGEGESGSHEGGH